jgi:hypothetical protein
MKRLTISTGLGILALCLSSQVLAGTCKGNERYTCSRDCVTAGEYYSHVSGGWRQCNMTRSGCNSTTDFTDGDGDTCTLP